MFGVGTVPLRVIILFFQNGHFGQVRKEGGRKVALGGKEGGRKVGSREECGLRWEGGRNVALGGKEGGREVGRKKDRRKHRKYSYNNLLCVLHSIVLTVELGDRGQGILLSVKTARGPSVSTGKRIP